MKSYLEILRLRGKANFLARHIEQLKQKAVEELRKEGYSFDEITKLIGIGKVTAIRLSKLKGS